MLSSPDLPSCIERIGRRRKTISSARQRLNERGVLKLQIPPYYMETLQHSCGQILGLWLGQHTQRGSHFHNGIYYNTTTLLNEIHPVPKDPSCCIYYFKALCPASLHELKSFLSKWRAGWSWTTARIICSTFFSASALSEARKGYQTPADVVKSVWIWFISSVDIHRGNK